MLNLTWLFTPATNPERMQKALGFPMDCLIFDLKDSALPSEKAAARQNIVELVNKRTIGGPQLGVRFNDLGSGFLADDLSAMAGLGLDFVYLPRLDNLAALETFIERLAGAEKLAGLNGPQPRVYAVIETAKGIMNLESMAFGPRRLAGLMFGAGGFTLSLGVDRTKDGAELLYPRAKLALCCAAAGLESIDTVFSDAGDQAGFLAETRQAKQLGFTGKALMHPCQIEPVKQVYAPSPEQAARARRQVKGYEAGLMQGLASVTVDGKLVDLPVYKRAQKIIEIAAAISNPYGVK